MVALQETLMRNQSKKHRIFRLVELVAGPELGFSEHRSLVVYKVQLLLTGCHTQPWLFEI